MCMRWGGARRSWGRELGAPAAACTVRSSEGVRMAVERRGGRREEGQGESQKELGWQPCSLFHTKSGARLSVKCLCVPKHHYCLLRQ